MIKIMNNKEKAFQQGLKATSFEDCPYESGQVVHACWIDGFIQSCAEKKIIPEGASEYVRGRISYGIGLSLEETLKTEPATPSVTKGWLTERVQHMSKGFGSSKPMPMDTEFA
jgi:ribosome modulation factor